MLGLPRTFRKHDSIQVVVDCKHDSILVVVDRFSKMAREARTRHRRCRTHVRRCETRRRAGDAAARASGRVDPTWFSRMRADASRYGFDARRREPIRADSGRNRPVSAKTADSGRNSKKKKKKNPERTVLLNSNPTSAQIHSKRQNTLLTLRFTRFVSVLVCSLPLCVWFISFAGSSPLLHQYILSSALSHAFLTQVCFQS